MPFYPVGIKILQPVNSLLRKPGQIRYETFAELVFDQDYNQQATSVHINFSITAKHPDRIG